MSMSPAAELCQRGSFTGFSFLEMIFFPEGKASLWKCKIQVELSPPWCSATSMSRLFQTGHCCNACSVVILHHSLDLAASSAFRSPWSWCEDWMLMDEKPFCPSTHPKVILSLPKLFPSALGDVYTWFHLSMVSEQTMPIIYFILFNTLCYKRCFVPSDTLCSMF